MDFINFQLLILIGFQVNTTHSFHWKLFSIISHI